MDYKQEICKINKMFGEGWFEKVISANAQTNALSLEEQIRFVKENSIHGQTGFFRDLYMIPILEKLVLPSFKKNPSEIAFIGCSDGREVYSTLVHFWKDPREIFLHGYDINPESIAEARAGGKGMRVNSKGYRIESNYSIEKSKLENWKKFGAEGEVYVFKQGQYDSFVELTFTDKAKERTNFDLHDITESPLPKKYEAIVMQNVLCHYTPKGREIILENILESLTSGGWLVCERCDLDSANATKEYDHFMSDLLAHGFTKQKTIIPTWFSQKDDVSCWSRTYRKVN